MRWRVSEEKVLALIQEYFPEAKLAAGSGNVHHDGDQIGIPGVYVDTKDQSKNKGHSVKASEWEKAAEQASKEHPPREPMIVTVNKDGEVMAHCKLDLLLLALSYVPKGVL